MSSQEQRQAELAAVTRYQRAAIPVVSPADFHATDEDFFKGRLNRLRPPFPHERTKRHALSEELGFSVVLLVRRTSVEAPWRPVALMALDEPSAASLEAELPRMGNDNYPDLLRKPKYPLVAGRIEGDLKMLKTGTVTIYQGHAGDPCIADIAGCTGRHINSQEELDLLHRLVAEGKPIPPKPAPSQKPPRR